jgi:phage shock protein A
MNDNQDAPEFAREAAEAGAEVDRRLEQTEPNLERTRNEIAKLRKSIRASLDGSLERAAALLDELDKRTREY